MEDKEKELWRIQDRQRPRGSWLVHENDILHNNITTDNKSSWPDMKEPDSSYFQIGLTTESTLRTYWIRVSSVSNFFGK